MSGTPEQIESFILEHLESYGKLEVLLQLAEHPDRVWTATALCSVLRTDDAWTLTTLSELTSRGLAARIDGDPIGWRYAPASPELSSAVATLIACVPTYRARIVSMIYAPRPRRVQDFADAFRLKKGSKDG